MGRVRSSPFEIFDRARTSLFEELDSLHIPYADDSSLLMAACARIASHLQSILSLHEKDFSLEAEIVLRSAMETVLWAGAIVRCPEFVELVRLDEGHHRRGLAKRILANVDDNWNLLPEDMERLQGVSSLERDERSKLAPRDVATYANLPDLYELYYLLSTNAAHPSSISLDRHWQFDAHGNLIHFQPRPRDSNWDTIFRYCCVVACQTAELIGEYRKVPLEWPAELMRQCEKCFEPRP